MIFEDIADFTEALPRTGGLAGLDLGTKTIGVAVSDGLRQVASPYPWTIVWATKG